jgi:membrane protease subunit HflK
MQESEAYKQRVIENARGEAARFTEVLAEYRKAPGVTRERLYLDAMQQVLSSSSKVLVDQKSGSNLLYLPLDKILQMSGTNGGAEAAAAKTPQAAESVPVAPPTQPEAAGVRSRESFRGREREAR